jgi:hypothetical protein
VIVCGFDDFAAPSGTVDVIVFSDSLQFADAPLAVLDRYRRFLRDHGIVIVSVFQNRLETAPARIFLRTLEKACDDGRYTVLELAEARNPRLDLLWRISVLR